MSIKLTRGEVSDIIRCLISYVTLATMSGYREPVLTAKMIELLKRKLKEN